VNSLNTEKEEENGKGKKKKNQEFDSVSLGTISQVSYGTPIPLQRHISQDTLNHEFVKPSLEKWAQGFFHFQTLRRKKRILEEFFNKKNLLK
jgi:hypothetical protein